MRGLCAERRALFSTAVSPCRDHERRHDRDPEEREHEHARLEPPVVPRRPVWNALRPERFFGLDDVARVELVDVQLPVEAQIVRVRAQEALHVCVARQHRKLLVLEGVQVLAADLRGLLDRGKVEPLTHTRLAQAVADLEHRRILARSRPHFDYSSRRSSS